MKLTGMLTDTYAWRLEVAVWGTKQHAKDVARCKPRLLLVYRDYDDEDPEDYTALGSVEYDLGSTQSGKAGWFTYYVPPDAEHIPAHYDEGTPTPRLVLDKGTTRYPRESAEEALKHLLSLVKDRIPPSEFAALSSISSSFINLLKTQSAAFERRHK